MKQMDDLVEELRDFQKMVNNIKRLLINQKGKIAIEYEDETFLDLTWFIRFYSQAFTKGVQKMILEQVKKILKNGEVVVDEDGDILVEVKEDG